MGAKQLVGQEVKLLEPARTSAVHLGKLPHVQTVQYVFRWYVSPHSLIKKIDELTQKLSKQPEANTADLSELVYWSELRKELADKKAALEARPRYDLSISNLETI